jgi:hypothetical protein
LRRGAVSVLVKEACCIVRYTRVKRPLITLLRRQHRIGSPKVDQTHVPNMTHDACL